MSIPKFSSRKAEVSIQKAIQDVELGVKLLIYKASDVHVLLPSTFAYYLAGCLPKHLAHKTLPYFYYKD